MTKRKSRIADIRLVKGMSAELQALILSEGSESRDATNAIRAYMALDREARDRAARLLRRNKTYGERLRMVLLLRNVACRLEEVNRNQRAARKKEYEPEGGPAEAGSNSQTLSPPATAPPAGSLIIEATNGTDEEE